MDCDTCINNKKHSQDISYYTTFFLIYAILGKITTGASIDEIERFCAYMLFNIVYDENNETIRKMVDLMNKDLEDAIKETVRDKQAANYVKNIIEGSEIAYKAILKKINNGYGVDEIKAFCNDMLSDKVDKFLYGVAKTDD